MVGIVLKRLFEIGESVFGLIQGESDTGAGIASIGECRRAVDDQEKRVFRLPSALGLVTYGLPQYAYTLGRRYNPKTDFQHYFLFSKCVLPYLKST